MHSVPICIFVFLVDFAIVAKPQEGNQFNMSVAWVQGL